MTRHQYGISELVSQTSFGGETSGGVAKCRLFSHATYAPTGVMSHNDDECEPVYLLKLHVHLERERGILLSLLFFSKCLKA